MTFERCWAELIVYGGRLGADIMSALNRARRGENPVNELSTAHAAAAMVIKLIEEMLDGE